MFPEVEAPLDACAGSRINGVSGRETERQDGMATWHAGMVAGARAVADSMAAPAAGAEGAAGPGRTLTTNPAAEDGPSPPLRSQPTHGPLFFVDLDAARWSNDRSMYLGDGHHLNDAGHTALAELLRPIVEPLWRARTAR
jgi:lysophospholipase L1-like esterase